MKVAVLLLIAAVSTSPVAAAEVDCKVPFDTKAFALRTSVLDFCAYDLDMSACYSHYDDLCFTFNPFRAVSGQYNCNVYETKNGDCYGNKNTDVNSNPYCGSGDVPCTRLIYQDSSMPGGMTVSHIHFVCDADAAPGNPSKIEVDSAVMVPSGYARMNVYVKEACPDQVSSGGFTKFAIILLIVALTCIVPICAFLCVAVVGCSVGCRRAFCCGGPGARGSKGDSHRAKTKAAYAVHDGNIRQPLLGNKCGGGPAVLAPSAVVLPLPTYAAPAMMPHTPGTQARGQNDLQLFKRGDGAVYLLIDSMLRATPKGIADGSMFLHTFGIPNDAKFMNGHVDSFPVGMPLPEFFQAVKGAGSHGVYLLMDEPSAPGVMTKRLIAGPTEFSAYRLAMEKVATMDAGRLSTIPDGPVIRLL